MLFGRKKAPQKVTKANERMARRLLGKESGRKVFGFLCSPDIWARMKGLADRLNVPLFGLMEHAIQLAAGQITKMAENAEECELLRRHIMEDHIGRRTIEKVARFDEEMADILDNERRERFKVEAAVRQIVVGFARRGVSLKDIAWFIDYGMRCWIAVARGQPVPRDSPPKDE